MVGYSKSDQLGAKKESQTTKNISANKKLEIIYRDKGKLGMCEVQIAQNCLKESKMSYGVLLDMTYAHKHKRDWYKVNPERRELLASYDETVRCCLNCHQLLEASEPLTKRTFKRLRGV